MSNVTKRSISIFEINKIPNKIAPNLYRKKGCKTRLVCMSAPSPHLNEIMITSATKKSCEDGFYRRIVLQSVL